ncbi:MAG: hypothetical protein GX142_06350 [Chloroflexi bacterium]|nr:hypothetical protein [Chloroflexota bacterium]
MRKFLRPFCCLIILTLFLTCSGVLPAGAQKPSQAEALLQTMSAEEKVAQLFLITFEGHEIDEDSELYQLISRYQIGGVVLRTDNNNFPAEETTASIQQLTHKLQDIVWEFSSQVIDIEDTGGTAGYTYVPLLIGVQQLGDGYPGDQILSGLTQLPSHLAIGASWDVNLANQVGEILGAELSSLGINLYLGPNLDVLEAVNNEAASSLGVNAFGGNPFWVGELGKAFVSGVHVGSNNRMLVVARNFPGTGNADRYPDEEVSTVRKSLEQLKQVELVPYFSVSVPPLGDPGRVDGIMVSHNRYQGLQGNIRANTRPISFDSNALQQVFSLPEFAAWREEGGLIVTDNLGSSAVRRFLDPNGTSFDARLVARNAFLAGNDVLYLDDFIATDDTDPYATFASVIDSFVQKYREDSAFAKRVDASVLRILEAKFNIYSNFSSVWHGNGDLEQIGIAHEVTFDVAQAGLTLISPSEQELDTVLIDPPQWYDNVIIFTDVRTVSHCESCPQTTDVSANALANALINLYGPQAGGQILQNRIHSYAFTQLSEFLDNLETESTELIGSTIRTANWVVFNVFDISEQYPSSNALQRILAERSELLTGKNVIVFSLGLPTYLDATDISKVTAYYGLFSKAPEFWDVAARVLMQESDLSGALPVSLNAVGYDLAAVTSPDPAQVIRLELVAPAEGKEAQGAAQEGDAAVDEQAIELEGIPGVTKTPEPTPLPSFNVGDMITIRTSPILDHNRNIVPDGTQVRFNFRITGEPGITQQFESSTAGGVALFNYRIESAGGIDITASSGMATQSETLQINISSEGIMSIFAFTPTPMFSPTPDPLPMATLTPTPQPTPTITPGPIPADYPSLGDWAFGVLVMGVGSALTFLIGMLWWGSSRWGLRSALCALIGGLLAYTYLNLGFDGTAYWIQKSGTVFVVEIVIVGLLLGWIVALVWWMRTEGRYPLRRGR